MPAERAASATGDPPVRPTARVVVLDPADRVLLFLATLDTGERLWFPPGGGVEAGETYEEAAQRELREESGLDLPVGPWIWTRERVGGLPDPAWTDGPVRFVERYYLLRTAAFEPRPTQIDAHESYMHGDAWWHWWTLDELRAPQADALVVPRRIAQLLLPIIAGDIPASPVDANDP